MKGSTSGEYILIGKGFWKISESGVWETNRMNTGVYRKQYQALTKSCVSWDTNNTNLYIIKREMWRTILFMLIHKIRKQYRVCEII